MRDTWLTIVVKLLVIPIYAALFWWTLGDVPWAQKAGLWLCAFFFACYGGMALVLAGFEVVSWWRSRR